MIAASRPAGDGLMQDEIDAQRGDKLPLHRSMIEAGMLIHDARHALTDSADQPTPPALPFSGLAAAPSCKAKRVEAIFRDIDPDGDLHHLFQSYAYHSEPVSEYPFRPRGNNAGDHTLARPYIGPRASEPPPPPGINAESVGSPLSHGAGKP
jgi:hypothetical protein